MFRMILLAGLLLCFSEVSAITWEFSKDGDTQGWTAVKLMSQPVEMTVVDGILRVAVPQMTAAPTFRLISPRLGLDSRLFDQVRVRLRVVNPAPLDIAMALVWTNALSSSLFDTPLNYTNRETRRAFFANTRLRPTTDWQEIALSDFGGDVTIRDIVYHGAWEGELNTIALTFSAGEIPEWLEVDRIILTGVEEQLQGELPPPGEQVSAGPGNLYTVGVPAFIHDGLAHGHTPFGSQPAAASIDWDRDGDRDVMAYWGQQEGLSESCGWSFLENYGGVFAPRLTRSFTDCGYLVGLLAGDVDGDGGEELVVSQGTATEIWRPTVLLEPEVVCRWEGRGPLGVGDVVTGGGAEVVTLSALQIAGDEVENTVEVWSYQAGQFVAEMASVRVDRRSPLAAADYNGDGQMELLWVPPRGATVWQLTTLEDEPAQPDGVLDSGIGRLSLIRVGDLDGDGDVDMVAGREDEVLVHGLDIWQNSGQGNLQQRPWYDTGVAVGGARAVYTGDLDGDGMADWAFVNQDLSSGPAVVVSLGRQGALPQEEGWYPLRVGGDGQLLGADVDGDSDTDLLVLGGEGGELQVLINRTSEGVTAVAESGGAGVPPVPVLGLCYPNPFNPRTWIPFSVPLGQELVSLGVYNLLGQSVRTLGQGPQSAGAHLVPWDGRDDHGRPLSAGVYLCRLQAGDQVQTRKLLKVE